MNPNDFKIKYILKDIILEPSRASEPHPRSQEPPSKSGKAQERCPDLFFSVLEI